MKIAYSEYTDVGGRKNNEDSLTVAVGEQGYLFVVADGLGGHDNGEEASAIAAESIKYSFEREGAAFDPERAIVRANELILKKQAEEKSSMKTTVTLAWVGEHRTYLAHVGDSRIYAFDGERIVYQSLDHSVSQMAVTAGEIRPTELRSHSDRNKLTRALGVSEDVRPYVYMLDNSEYTGLLLCSDGFWEYVYEEEMLASVKSSEEPRKWIDELRKLHDGRARGGHDNNTAIAVSKPWDESSVAAPSAKPLAYASADTQRFDRVPFEHAVPKGRGRKKTAIILTAVAAALLLVVFGLLWYMFFGNGGKKDGENKGTFLTESEESFETVNESEVSEAREAFFSAEEYFSQGSN